MYFLETVTFLGDNILIPVNRIKFISLRYVKDWEIHIVGDEEMDLSEHFGDDEEKATKRWEQIKKIIKAA